jgi:hypothetical protein
MRAAIVIIPFLAILIASCSKTSSSSEVSPYGEYPESTAYEMQCITGPPPPGPSGETTGPTGEPIKWEELPIPSPLPVSRSAITPQACPALGDLPHFPGRDMPGMVVVVDCNARVVRFRTRDWQLSEASNLNPNNDFDLRVMYIVRFLRDADGNENCWARIQGHITGHADCAVPARARLNWHVDWSMDETPPSIMEPPAPGMADSRNGKHCRLRQGNCAFGNTAKMGCGG